MNIAFFILYCSIMTVTPGPTNIMILSIVHNYGVKRALLFSLGSIFAFFLLLLFSLAFNSVIISYLPKIIIVLQGIGALYMLYLAYYIFKSSENKKVKKEIASFKSGFLMQFINPKVVIFTLSVFPSFIFPYYSSSLSLVLFVFLITLIASMAFLSWVLFGKVLKTFLDRYNKVFNNIMALFLLVCAVMISGVFN